jgi:hypothetical protein
MISERIGVGGRPRGRQAIRTLAVLASKQERMRAVTTSDAQLFGVVVTGIVVIGANHCPCTVRLGRTGAGTFSFEEASLPNQISANGSPPLRVCGPDAMPVDSLLRSLPALLTGKPVIGDIDFTLLGVGANPTADRAAFVAAIRLRSGANQLSDLRVRLVPDTSRPTGFAWASDCTIDRWLRNLERATRRCPSFATIGAD